MQALVDDRSPTIAQVEPLTHTRAIQGPFDYRLRPEQLDVGVGSLLRVPFGRRQTLGVVVALSRTSALDPERLAEPEAVLPPSVPPDLVQLARWMASEYCSTVGRALSLVLAPGAADGPRRKRVLCAELTDAGRAALSHHLAADRGQPLTGRQRAALTRVQEQGVAIAAEVGTPLLRNLERRGIVLMESRVLERRPRAPTIGLRRAGPPPLTDHQEQALVEVLGALEERRCERFLLHGVTGSGKTEVYLRAVQATLAAGRGAIVLVPEIALTPQAVGRFQERFGDVVAVLHSALAGGERQDEWLRLRDGEARVCVGPRSAVFAPVLDLGLIVVDEEHDGSYKHEGDPRYDARTVALQRAEQHEAVLLLGSATPRPESAVALRRLRLPERVDRRSLPAVEVLDMRGAHHPLHPVARMALADVRRSGQKGIVLLNRRGWSNFLSCRSCGEVYLCPDCDVALVLHRASGTLACHHCGYRQTVPRRCHGCGSVSLARHGAGTERLEHELRAALADGGFPVLRLDADVAAGKDRIARTLEEFESARTGLLVGTQMVAKGHDFPEVTLGVVLDADQTLRFPDFRAEERTFSLITQLAGRAGRGEGGGRVLVQTLAPTARPIRFAASHDSEGFLSEELTRRKALGYPPFGSLIRVVCAAASDADAESVADGLRRLISGSEAVVLGPAPLFRLRGRFRSQLVIKTADRGAATAAVSAAVREIATRASRLGVSISIDVDPQ